MNIYPRVASKCVHLNQTLQAQPTRKSTITPQKYIPNQTNQTQYHVRINLRPQAQNMSIINDSPKVQDSSFITVKDHGRNQSQKILDVYNSQGQTQRLTMVKSMSTSFSPFKKHQEQVRQNKPIQNVRISLQSPQQFQSVQHQPQYPVMRESSSHQIRAISQYQTGQGVKYIPPPSQHDSSFLMKMNQSPMESSFLNRRIPLSQIQPRSVVAKQDKIQFELKDTQQEAVLDETIDKLDFLERKINNIMERNDKLRSLLKKNDSIKKSQHLHQQQLQYQQPIFNSYTNSIYQADSAVVTRQDTVQSIVEAKFTPMANMVRESPQSTSRKDFERTGSFIDKTTTFSRRRSMVRGEHRDTQSSSQDAFNFFQSGRGKKIYPNGYMYEGEWSDGVRQGLGTLFNPLGVIIYQGEWRQDFFHGRGRQVNELPVKLGQDADFSDYDQLQDCWRTYEGQFVDGMKQGLGVLNFGEIKYHGNFDGDRFHGNGQIIVEKDQKVLMKGYWDRGILKR